jgi:hypothetical protein
VWKGAIGVTGSISAIAAFPIDVTGKVSRYSLEFPKYDAGDFQMSVRLGVPGKDLTSGNATPTARGVPKLVIYSGFRAGQTTAWLALVTQIEHGAIEREGEAGAFGPSYLVGSKSGMAAVSGCLRSSARTAIPTAPLYSASRRKCFERSAAARRAAA